MRSLGLVAVTALCGCAAAAPASAPEAPRYRFSPEHPELDCHHLVSLESERDLTILQRACQRRGPCACALYGRALAHSSNPSNQREGVRRLDGACSAGALHACDDGLLLAALCAQGDASAYCSELRRGGAVLVVDPEPAWKTTPLPLARQTCFAGEISVSPASWCFGEGACTEREATVRDVFVCLGADQLWWLDGDWDVQPVRWDTRGPEDWRALAGEREVLALVGRSARIGADTLEELPYSRRASLWARIARLPSVGQACKAAGACQRALEDARLSHGEDLEEGGFDEGLSDCLRALAQSKRELERLDPEGAERACTLPE